MAVTPEEVAGRLAAVRARIAEVAAGVGRRGEEVSLLPVSKTHPVEYLAEVARVTGVRHYGENRPQELAAKAVACPDLEWVMIGPLQRNKAGLVAAHAGQFQALDSLRVAQALDRALQVGGRCLDVMVEVNTSGEAAKHGVAPGEALELVRGLAVCSALRPVGLMTLAALGDESRVRGCFRALRGVQGRLRDDGFDLPEMSMGMSDDFVWAVEEGSTLVRLGTAVFGPRVTR